MQISTEPIVRCEKLKSERQDRGWSQAALAIKWANATDKIKSATTVYQLESGIRPAYGPTREELADIFGMSVDELFPERLAVIRDAR